MKKIFIILLSLSILSCEQEDFNIEVEVVDDIALTQKNVGFSINLLDNDKGQDINLREIDNSTNSTIVIENDGLITYTPNTDFVGEDDIRYSIEDIFGAISYGYLKVTVE